MQVNNNTRWEDVSPVYAILEDASLEGLKESALKRYGVDGGFYGLTIEQLISITSGDLTAFNISGDGSAYEHIFLDELKNFLEKYLEILTSYSIKQTSDEERASKSCAEMTFAESLLIFTRGYFSLHSFTEAGKITLAELLIAKKDAYNTSVFQRMMNKIQQAKFKK